MRAFIHVHVSDQYPGLGTVVLDREPTNTLTRQAFRELAAAAAEVSRRDDIAVVILFGGHEFFSAGDDVTDFQRLNPQEPASADGAGCAAVALDLA